jgi:hypothetical protein
MANITTISPIRTLYDLCFFSFTPDENGNMDTVVGF